MQLNLGLVDPSLISGTTRYLFWESDLPLFKVDAPGSYLRKMVVANPWLAVYSTES